MVGRKVLRFNRMIMLPKARRRLSKKGMSGIRLSPTTMLECMPKNQASPPPGVPFLVGPFLDTTRVQPLVDYYPIRDAWYRHEDAWCCHRSMWMHLYQHHATASGVFSDEGLHCSFRNGGDARPFSGWSLLCTVPVSPRNPRIPIYAHQTKILDGRTNIW